MPYFQLTSGQTGQALFAGQFDSWKHCLETAIDQSITLDHLHLTDADIGAANLDGGVFNYAIFTRCALPGANLSEASFIKARFADCDLRQVSFCDSVLVGAKFLGSRMEGCDLHFADLRGVQVDCPQFLQADFSQTAHMTGGSFTCAQMHCPMSRPPVFVRGLGMDAFLLDEHVVLGGRMVLHKDQLSQTPQGLAGAFTRHGLKPDNEALERLWRATRGDASLKSVA